MKPSHTHLSAHLPTRLRSECEDLATYLVGLGVILLTWVLVLDWNPHLLIPGHDGPAVDLLYMTELARGNAEWKNVLYRSGWLGGMKMYTVSGLSWCLPFLIRLGFAPYAALNGFIFFIQSIYAYLGIKAVSSLLSLWRGLKISLPWRLKLPMIWVFAFAPVIGWRVCYGHSTVAMASQFFIAVLTGLLSAFAGTYSVFLTLICTLVAYTCFQSTMVQPVLYAIVFGTPVFLGIFWSGFRFEFLTQWPRILCKAFLPIIAGFFLALDNFSLFLTQSNSGDSARSLNSGSVVYSYLTGQVADWIDSIPWTLDLIRADLPVFLRHEVNYPLGPLLGIFLVLFPWKKHWKMALGLGISAVLIAGFSDHWPAVSSPLIALIPPLRSFRVPTRSALIIALALPIYAIASLLNISDLSASKKSRLQGLPLFTALAGILAATGTVALLFLLPALDREFALWAGSLALVCAYLIFRRSPLPPWFPLLFLGVGSLLSFAERRLPYLDAEKVMTETAILHSQVIAQAPELGYPLTRAYLKANSPIFGTNSGMSIGISSLSGYGFPLRRYLQLIQALQGAPYEPTIANLEIPLHRPPFLSLRLLYNVKYDLNLSPSLQMEVAKAGPTAGPAWFVRSLEAVSGFEELAEKLQRDEKVRTTGYLIRDDLAIPTDLFQRSLGSACPNARVEPIFAPASSPDLGQTFEFQLKTEAECPLVIATNYSSQWSAFILEKDQENGQESGVKKSLQVFPVDGALTGVLVPPGSWKLTLETSVQVPFWASLGKGVGLILLALLTLGH